MSWFVMSLLFLVPLAQTGIMFVGWGGTLAVQKNQDEMLDFNLRETYFPGWLIMSLIFYMLSLLLSLFELMVLGEDAGKIMTGRWARFTVYPYLFSIVFPIVVRGFCRTKSTDKERFRLMSRICTPGELSSFSSWRWEMRKRRVKALWKQELIPLWVMLVIFAGYVFYFVARYIATIKFYLEKK